MSLKQRPGKKYIICIWCKVLKVQQSLIKVLSRTYRNISRSIIAKSTPRKKIRKCFLSTKYSSLKIEAENFSCPGTIITFSSKITFGISEERVVSFDAVLCMLRGSSTEAYSVPASFLFSLTSFLSEIFFLVTVSFYPEFQ